MEKDGPTFEDAERIEDFGEAGVGGSREGCCGVAR